MTDIERIIEDLEHQLDVLETAIGSGRVVTPPEPFVAPAGTLPAASRSRAQVLQQRLLAAQALVAGELERARREVAMADGAQDAPRFLDTTF